MSTLERATIELPVPVLTRSEVQGLFRIKDRQTIDKRVKRGLLPPPIKQGPGRSDVWSSWDIRDVLRDQMPFLKVVVSTEPREPLIDGQPVRRVTQQTRLAKLADDAKQ